MKSTPSFLCAFILTCTVVVQACSGDGGGDPAAPDATGSGGTTNTDVDTSSPTTTSGATSDPCDSCAGCCSGSTCIQLDAQSEGACGRAGAKCTSCITGEVCVEGKCIVDSGQCSPASCPTGCCDGTTCIQRSEQDWLACGTAASRCDTCNPATLCNQGMCTDFLAPGEPVRIRINTVEVATTDDGDDWDLLGGAPDLFVCVTDGVVEGCTTAGADTFSVDWGDSGSLTDADGDDDDVYFTTDQLYDEALTYTVFDDDVTGGYVAQSGTLPQIADFESKYAIADEAPNLVLLTFSLY